MKLIQAVSTETVSLKRFNELAKDKKIFIQLQGGQFYVPVTRKAFNQTWKSIKVYYKYVTIETMLCSDSPSYIWIKQIFYNNNKAQ